MEILDYIHNNNLQFKNNNKWFQGFSDASILTYYLTTNYNLATIHCYNAEDYGSLRNITKLKDTLDSIIKLEQDYSFIQDTSQRHIEEYTREINDLDLEDYNTVIRSSSDNILFSGRLIGGWIEAIATICGTKYDNTRNFCKQFNEGIIWYIDNCELTSPMLRRKLWQLKEADYFVNCNGILIGRQPDDNFDGDYDYNRAIADTFKDLNIPVIMDTDIGHFFPQWMLINGCYAEIYYNKGKAKILQRLKQ